MTENAMPANDLANFDLYAGLSDEVRHAHHQRADLTRARLIAAGRFDPLTAVPEVSWLDPHSA